MQNRQLIVLCPHYLCPFVIYGPIHTYICTSCMSSSSSPTTPDKGVARFCSRDFALQAAACKQLHPSPAETADRSKKMVRFAPVLLAVWLALLCVHTAPVEGTYGFDVSSYLSVSDFSCLLNNSYQFAIIRAYRSIGVLH